MGTVMNDYVAVEWLDIWNTRCVNISYHTFCPFTERMMTNLIATVITCVTITSFKTSLALCLFSDLRCGCVTYARRKEVMILCSSS